eukprot:SAG25_NODE_11482_length_303_cov_0.759804_1_plen_88_part_10
MVWTLVCLRHFFHIATKSPKSPSGPNVATSGMKKSKAAANEKPIVEQMSTQNLVKNVTVQNAIKSPAPMVVMAPITTVMPIVRAASVV